MESRLIPINALIALTTGEGRWPTPLRDAGYLLHGIEAQIIPAAKSKVVVDALLASAAARIVVLAECKSGQNLREPQMKAYAAVTPYHVVRDVGVPFRDPRIEILVVGLLEHADRLRKAMAELNVDLPLLLVGHREVRFDGALTGIPAFSVPVPGRPPRIIAIDDQSSDEDFVKHLLPGLIAASARTGTKFVGVDTLLDGAIPWWGVYHHSGGRKRMCRRAMDALRPALAEHFPRDFSLEARKGQDCGVIRILRTPTEYRPRGMTQGWQRLQRQAERAIGQRRRPPESPGQISFSFEELGLDAETPGEPE